MSWADNIMLDHHVAREAKRVHPSPSDAQREAGNYAKGHPKIHGMEISIETAKGQNRTGTGADGEPWSVKMPAHYGYIKRTEGADGDQIDVYLGPHTRSPKAFVVDQLDADSGNFDEHKSFLGFANRKQVESAYRRSFSDDRAHERMGGIKEMSVDEFKQWARKGDTKNPVATEMADPEGYADGGTVFPWVEEGNDPVGAATRTAASRVKKSVRRDDQFDTRLDPPQERLFQQWKAQHAPEDSGADYDLRGAFVAGLTPAENGHWPDTFKKPNHPTFSVESQYAKDRPELAGRWDGPNHDQYVPAGFADGGAVNPFAEFVSAPADDANPFAEFVAPKATSAPVASPPDDHGLAERQKLSTVEKAISPITGYPATYSKMKNEALEQAGHGLEQVSKPKDAWDFAKGVGNTALGTLGYVASPVNAAYRSIVGQPVEDVTGIPREYTEFASQLATPGLGLTRMNPKVPGAPLSPSEMQPSVAGRAAVPEAEGAKALDIPLSRGQATRDLDAIRYEDMAARGAYGPKAQEEAAKFFDEQFKAIQSAGVNIGETLGRDSTKAADVGEAAATVNADVLSTAEKARAVVAEAERRAAAEAEAHRGMVSDAGRTINEAVQGSGPAVGNIREAGEVVGQGVRGAAEDAAQKYKGLYKEAFDLPGEFGVDTFTNIGNSIKGKITSGESPVIVDTTTPSASAALDDLGKIQGLKFANKAHVPGQELVSAAEGPSELVAVNLKGVDQARKLLVQRYQQAKARGRSTQDFSDQRAMERIIDAFDDHIEQSISNGLFSGDPRALSALQEARSAFSSYRKTYRPNPGDDVSTALNRIVSRNATPEEIGNMITGSGKLGNAGLPVRLATKLKDVLGPDSDQWSAIRQAIWQKASNVRNSAGEVDAGRSAQSVTDFTNSTLARTVFAPHELSAMRSHAAGIRDLDHVIEMLPATERASAVKSAYQQAFETGDIGGTQATIFRRIIDGTATPQETTQAIFSAVNSTSSGNVIRALKAIEKVVGPESDTMNAVRQGVWQKLTQNAATKDQPGQQKVAQAIGEFLNGNGRLVAKQLYSEPELALMKKYAEAVKLTVIPKYARTNSDTAPAILAAAHKYAGAIAASIGELFGHGLTGAAAGYGVGKMLQGGVNKVKDMKELNRIRGQFEPASSGRTQIAASPMRGAGIPPTAAPLLSSPPRLPAPSLPGTMPTAAEPNQRQ